MLNDFEALLSLLSQAITPYQKTLLYSMGIHVELFVPDGFAEAGRVALVTIAQILVLQPKDDVNPPDVVTGLEMLPI